MEDLSNHPDDLAAAVDRLLVGVYAQAAALPPPRRHEFAFNVLVNGLSSVLEAIRAEDPQARTTFAEIAALLLRDD